MHLHLRHCERSEAISLRLLMHLRMEIASARCARLAMTRYFGRFISLDELTTACRLRARPTALGTSMVMAWRRYSLTPSVATAGALSMNLHKFSTVSSRLAAGTTSLTMPWESARSGPTVAHDQVI